MAKIIAVMNLKGGIGKTITSTTIGYLLGMEHKKRVLIADFDAQGNASKTYGRYEPEGIGMSELLEHYPNSGEYTVQSIIKETPFPNIDIITSNMYLMRTNAKLLGDTEKNQINRFKEAIEEVRGNYDYVICDCGLLLDMAVLNAIVACDLLIAPVKLGGYEADAREELEEQINELRALNPGIRVKSLVTMRQGNKTTKEFEDWVKNASGYDAFKTSIRRSVVVERATMCFVPLPMAYKNGIATKDYRAVTEELIKDMEV